jgi:hypothetical protein
METDARFYFSQGVWWREVKPFFYYPADPMARIAPDPASPIWWPALGGYYHMVPEGSTSNGVIVVNEFSDPVSYSLEMLRKKVRHEIRRGLSQFELRRLSILNELLEDGYRIYVRWEKRTADVRVKRSTPAVFQRWITSVFNNPYELILGAYLNKQLVGFIIAHAIEGVANAVKCFSDPSDDGVSAAAVLNYAYLVICGQNQDILKAWNGLRSHKQSLEDFKHKLGYRPVKYPAFIHLRKAIRPLVRWWMPHEYKRLMGQYGN